MDCLFCKMVEGTIPTVTVFEDNDLLAFRDINPQAPTHILIIPKQHIANINECNESQQVLLGKMLLRAKAIANDEGIAKSGYRLIFNTNDHGGQTVYHIHLHLIGGRQMTWPPG